MNQDGAPCYYCSTRFFLPSCTRGCMFAKHFAELHTDKDLEVLYVFFGEFLSRRLNNLSDEEAQLWIEEKLIERRAARKSSIETHPVDDGGDPPDNHGGGTSDNSNHGDDDFRKNQSNQGTTPQHTGLSVPNDVDSNQYPGLGSSRSTPLDSPAAGTREMQHQHLLNRDEVQVLPVASPSESRGQAAGTSEMQHQDLLNLDESQVLPVASPSKSRGIMHQDAESPQHTGLVLLHNAGGNNQDPSLGRRSTPLDPGAAGTREMLHQDLLNPHEDELLADASPFESEGVMQQDAAPSLVRKRKGPGRKPRQEEDQGDQGQQDVAAPAAGKKKRGLVRKCRKDVKRLDHSNLQEVQVRVESSPLESEGVMQQDAAPAPVRKKKGPGRKPRQKEDQGALSLETQGIAAPTPGRNTRGLVRKRRQDVQHLDLSSLQEVEVDVLLESSPLESESVMQQDAAPALVRKKKGPGSKPRQEEDQGDKVQMQQHALPLEAQGRASPTPRRNKKGEGVNVEVQAAVSAPRKKRRQNETNQIEGVTLDVDVQDAAGSSRSEDVHSIPGERVQVEFVMENEPSPRSTGPRVDSRDEVPMEETEDGRSDPSPMNEPFPTSTDLRVDLQQDEVPMEETEDGRSNPSPRNELFPTGTDLRVDLQQDKVLMDNEGNANGSPRCCAECMCLCVTCVCGGKPIR